MKNIKEKICSVFVFLSSIPPVVVFSVWWNLPQYTMMEVFKTCWWLFGISFLFLLIAWILFE